MKMFEKIVERRLRKLITVNNMQYVSYNNCKKNT